MRLVTYLLISRIQSLVEIPSVQIKYFRSLLLRDSCEVGVASRWLLAGGIYNSSETESAILDPPNTMRSASQLLRRNLEYLCRVKSHRAVITANCFWNSMPREHSLQSSDHQESDEMKSQQQAERRDQSRHLPTTLALM